MAAGVTVYRYPIRMNQKAMGQLAQEMDKVSM